MCTYIYIYIYLCISMCIYIFMNTFYMQEEKDYISTPLHTVDEILALEPALSRQYLEVPHPPTPPLTPPSRVVLPESLSHACTHTHTCH